EKASMSGGGMPSVSQNYPDSGIPSEPPDSISRTNRPDFCPSYKPDAEAMAAMGKFNDAMKQAGVLLALDGLQPPVTGARVSFAGGKATVADGPFPETNEALGGYW